MSPEDDLRTGLRSLLDNLDSPVTLPKRSKRETPMAMIKRYDPAWTPTASTIRARERQAGKRLVEIFKEREAITSPQAIGTTKLLIDRLIAPKPSEIEDA